MSHMRVASTPALRRMIRQARERGFNARLLGYEDRRLSPDGFHVLSVLVPFMDDGTAHRCRVLMKEPYSAEPVVGELDVLPDEFSALTTVDEVRDRLAAAEETS